MRRLLVPTLVLGGAVALDLWAPPVGLPPLVLASRVIFALVFLGAWRFRRGRTAAAVVLVAAASEALRLGLTPGQLVAVAILAALDFALLAHARDWPVASLAGGLRLGVLALQALAVVLLGRPTLAPLGELLCQPLTVRWLATTSLPQIAWLALVLAAVALLIAIWRRAEPLPAGLFGALIAFAVACERVDDGGLIFTTHYLTAAGVVLGLSLVENAFSLAFEDALTGLPTRRSLEETLAHVAGTYSIAMVDLDHFKKVNDRHGHDVGDQILKMVAAQLARIGGGGRAFRYGGEEFSVVFAGRTAAEALPHLEDLRESVAEKSFAVRAPDRPAKKPKAGRGRGAAGKTLRVTLSIGLAERTDKRPSSEGVLEAADKALYRSKKAGRNRVTVAR